MHRRLAIAVALTLAGCMVGPDYQRPQTTLPTTYADAPVAEANAATAAAIRVDWWTLYDDRMLNDLVAAALSDNLDVAAAVARIEEFDADLREANAALFPEIDLGATAARSRSSGAVAAPQSIRVSNDFRIALSTSFEIDFWGRLRRLLESARAQVLATYYAKDVVTLSLAGLTTQTYFLLRSLDAQITATRETLATREEYLVVVRRRVDAGARRPLGRRGAVEGARAAARAGRTSAGDPHLEARSQGGARRSRAVALSSDTADGLAVDSAGTAPGYPAGRGKPGRGERPDRRRQSGAVAPDLADRRSRRRKRRTQLARP
jgi:multidrug efflux system outer membrane protein